MKIFRIIFLGLFLLTRIISYSQTNSYDSLLFFVKQNNFEQVKKLNIDNTLLNQADEDGATPLMWAVFKGDKKLVNFFLEKGANPAKKGILFLDETRSGYYGSITCIAAGEGKLDILKLLIEKHNLSVNDRELNPNDANEATGWTPLHWAAAKGQIKVVKYLLGKGAQIDALDFNGGTALSYAIQAGATDVVLYLMKQKANLTILDSSKNSYLHYAVYYKDSHVIKKLISSKELINLKNQAGITPLHVAATIGNCEIITYLIQSGANIDEPDNDGDTPLLIAIAENQEEAAKTLIKLGADMNKANLEKWYPIHVAARQGNEEILKIILQKFNNINIQTSTGETPLFLAAYNNEYNCCYLLLKAGADTLIADANGKTPLYVAKEKGYAKIVKLFENVNSYENKPQWMQLNNIFLSLYPDGSKVEIKKYAWLALAEAVVEFEKNHPNIATAFNNLALAFLLEEKFDSSMLCFKKAIAIMENSKSCDTSKLATFWSNLADNYLSVKLYDSAIYALENAVNLYSLKADNDYKTLNNYLANLANYYGYVGNYSMAVKKYLQIINDYEEHNLQRDLLYTIALNNLGSAYQNIGQFALAEQTFLKCLNERKRILGDKDINYTNTLNNLAVFYEMMEKYDAAELYHLESLKIRKSLYTKQSLEYAVSLGNLAALYVNAGKIAKAKEAFTECDNIFKSLQKTNDPNYVVVLNGLANIAKEEYRWNDAENYLQQAINLKISSNAYNINELASSYNALALFYHETGNYVKADSILQMNENLQKSAVEKNLYTLLVTLNYRANTLFYLEKYDEAEKKYKASVQIAALLYDTLSNNYKQYQAFLANHYFYLADYTKAKDIYLRILANNKSLDYANNSFLFTASLQLFGCYKNLNQKKLADSLAFKNIKIYETFTEERKNSATNQMILIASTYNYLGNFERAIYYYQKALAIIEKRSSKYHDDYISCLENYAIAYKNQQFYEKALALLSEALDLASKVYAQNSIRYTNCLENLGEVYEELGDLNQAEHFYMKSYENLKNNQDSLNPNILPTLHRIGSIYKKLGQYEKASNYWIESLKTSRRIYGKEHPKTAQAINNLCLLLVEMKYYDRIDSLYNVALNIYEKSYGKHNADYAVTLHNLASYYDNIKEYQKSDSLYKEVLAIEKELLGITHPNYLNTINSYAVLKYKLNQYNEAEQLYLQTFNALKQKLGNMHPTLATVESNLAILYQRTGKIAKAEEWFTLANQNYKMQIDKVYPSLSEKEKELFFQTISHNFELTNSFAYQHYKQNNALSALIFNNSLANKSILLESTRNLLQLAAQSTDSITLSFYSQWNEKKSLLGQAFLMDIEERKNKNIDIEKLDAEVNDIEKKLLSLVHQNKSITNQQINDWLLVKKALNKDQAVIEFCKLHLFNGTTWSDTVKYIALIVTSESKYPLIVDLTTEQKLSKRLQFAEKGALSMHIYNMLWKPIETAIYNKKELFIAADGIVNLISFDGMKNESNKFISDLHQIHYVLSSRDVPNIIIKSKNFETIAMPTALLVGGANFDMSIDEMVNNLKEINPEIFDNTRLYAQVTKRNSVRRGEDWVFLQGTLDEVKGIQVVLQVAGVKTEVLSQNFANETRLKMNLKEQSPTILHIATHGFYTPQKEANFIQLEETISPFFNKDNPLLRSGLILSGANNAWSGIIPPDPLDDGILNAFEVANMNLFNTKLAVLSACETGLGDIKSGEGVFGLKRAFRMAGVENLLITLWEIPDLETAEMMTCFYKHLINEKQVFKAFKIAQQEMRLKYPLEPEKWAGFVLIE